MARNPKKTTAPKKPAAKKAPAKAKNKTAAAATDDTKKKKGKGGTKLVQDALRMPNAGQVVTLVRRMKALQEAVSDASQEMGESVARAVEGQHFDKAALSIARRLEKMTDNRLQITLPHLFAYIEALKLETRAERQGVLIKANDDDDGEDAESGGETTGAETATADEPAAGTSGRPTMRIVNKEEDAAVA